MFIRRFILFHGKRHSKEMRAREVGAFLTHLAGAGAVRSVYSISCDGIKSFFAGRRPCPLSS